MSTNLRAVLLALCAFGVFATHDVIVKVLGGSYSAFQIVFFSALFSFPVATIMLLRDATKDTLIPVHPWWVALRTAAAIGTGACAFYAFAVLPLAQTYAIIFASPLLITVLAIPFLGEKVGLRRALAVLVGLAGVMVVLQPGNTELGLGHLAALGCAVFGAFASIIVRKIGRDERSIVLMLYPLVANFVLMGVLLPFVYVAPPIEHLGMFFAMAVLATIATICVISAYKLGEAAIVAPMQYSQILWATAYGMLFFNELPGLNTALGASIIVASGVYIVLRESRKGEETTSPVLRTRTRLDTGMTPRVSTLIRANGDEPPLSPPPSSPRVKPRAPSMRGLPGRN
ncbi:MAG: DMT family transporter [Pseudomonadota bacterium]